MVRLLRPLADHVVHVERPTQAGSGNRTYQATGVQAGLRTLAELGVSHVLKTRSDVLLSDDFLGRVLAHAEAERPTLLATDLITRWEPFHLSDIVLAGRLEHLRSYFDTSIAYYEDGFSPEVEFTRRFVRSQGLDYTMRLEDWLRFLVDWVELVDFDEAGLAWLKRTGPIRAHWYSRSWPYLVDRDVGPVLGRPVHPAAVRWLGNTRLPLPLVAAVLRCADPLAELALRVVPFRVHERVGSPFHRYWIAPQTPEHARPLVPSSAQGHGPDGRYAARGVAS